MEIRRSGSRASGGGPAEWFTGAVRIDPLFQACTKLLTPNSVIIIMRYMKLAPRA